MARGDDLDPLSAVLAPPPNESPADREGRLRAEAEAKRISDAIDEEIQAQVKAEKKGPKPIKVLLLGQSESGKSTTLKNFQLLHSQKTFRTERSSWRAVIFLNVVRSIRLILEAIADVHALQNPPPSSPSGRSSTSASSSPISTTPPDSLPKLTSEHLKLRMRLLPLLQVEEVLIRKLTPAGSGEYEATSLGHITNLPAGLENSGNNSGGSDSGISGDGAGGGKREREIAVNTQFAWKNMFTRLMTGGSGRDSGEIGSWEGDPDDPGKIIHACGEDMIKLWGDPTIQSVLEFQKIRLQDLPGFFLDELDRITAAKYVPTDDDILRARLKTLGVSEYRFQVKDGSGFGSSTREWRIYDVGGHRSLVRAAWAPFFDDMNAILFLAPISCFDQVLEEDPNVNRLEDSILLWKSIVSNPLLSRTSLVLFLNKIDILKAKLASGIQFGHYIVSYGTRPNDYDNTSNYLRRKFQQIHKEHSPAPRTFYCHFTTVTDTKATSMILADVQDTIIRKQLQETL
ncbi:guanine nucleotide binding protein, alpha subunit [Irpex rosettiformis]|uniref:Guanine nucleotide binding protein, alpha subunit n=1 Tax=Irpex rosettiformis TaxID=378272 RepID=A0ACB8U695_9APHY|nr:guanine nucleotide binding protein, alpha subunit [Irpex rosettiformis]